jgi:hypothetical protein
VTKPRRWRTVVVVVAAGGALFGLAGCAAVFYLMFIGIERDVVAMPALSMTVVDENGAAVSGADVVLEHRTEPHGNLEARLSVVTGVDGRVATSLDKETERVLPLCMHGVPGHRHFVCVDHPGARPVLIELAPTEATITLTVSLRRDPSHTHDCTGDLDAMLLTSRTSRPDIQAGAEHVITVREP